MAYFPDMFKGYLALLELVTKPLDMLRIPLDTQKLSQGLESSIGLSQGFW